MNAMASPLLFDDNFEVLVVDPDGRKFDKGKLLMTSSTPNLVLP